MTFRTEVSIAILVTLTAGAISWKHALAGVIVGSIGHRLPYSTVLIVAGCAICALFMEYLRFNIGLLNWPSAMSFLSALILTLAAASSVHVSLRNWKNRNAF